MPKEKFNPQEPKKVSQGKRNLVVRRRLDRSKIEESELTAEEKIYYENCFFELTKK